MRQTFIFGCVLFARFYIAQDEYDCPEHKKKKKRLLIDFYNFFFYSYMYNKNVPEWFDNKKPVHGFAFYDMNIFIRTNNNVIPNRPGHLYCFTNRNGKGEYDRFYRSIGTISNRKLCGVPSPVTRKQRTMCHQHPRWTALQNSPTVT